MLREEDLKPVTKMLERHKLFFSSKCFQNGFSHFSFVIEETQWFPDLFTVCNIQTGLGCILPDKLIKAREMVHLLLTQALISQRSE